MKSHFAKSLTIIILLVNISSVFTETKFKNLDEAKEFEFYKESNNPIDSKNSFFINVGSSTYSIKSLVLFQVGYNIQFIKFINYNVNLGYYLQLDKKDFYHPDFDISCSVIYNKEIGNNYNLYGGFGILFNFSNFGLKFITSVDKKVSKKVKIGFEADYILSQMEFYRYPQIFINFKFQI
jgi:hypothetical protein